MISSSPHPTNQAASYLSNPSALETAASPTAAPTGVQQPPQVERSPSGADGGLGPGAGSEADTVVSSSANGGQTGVGVGGGGGTAGVAALGMTTQSSPGSSFTVGTANATVGTTVGGQSNSNMSVVLSEATAMAITTSTTFVGGGGGGAGGTVHDSVSDRASARASSIDGGAASYVAQDESRQINPPEAVPAVLPTGAPTEASVGAAAVVTGIGSPIFPHGPHPGGVPVGASFFTSHWSAHLHSLIAQLHWDIGVQRHRRRRQHAAAQVARAAATAAAAQQHGRTPSELAAAVGSIGAHATALGAASPQIQQYLYRNRSSSNAAGVGDPTAVSTPSQFYVGDLIALARATALQQQMQQQQVQQQRVVSPGLTTAMNSSGAGVIASGINTAAVAAATAAQDAVGRSLLPLGSEALDQPIDAAAALTASSIQYRRGDAPQVRTLDKKCILNLTHCLIYALLTLQPLITASHHEGYIGD